MQLYETVIVYLSIKLFFVYGMWLNCWCMESVCLSG